MAKQPTTPVVGANPVNAQSRGRSEAISAEVNNNPDLVSVPGIAQFETTGLANRPSVEYLPGVTSQMLQGFEMYYPEGLQIGAETLTDRSYEVGEMQSGWRKGIYGVGRAISSTATYGAAGIFSVVDAGIGLFSEGGNTKRAIEGGYSDGIREFQQYINDEILPVHLKKSDVEADSGIDYLTSSGFWAVDMADAAGFMGSMLVGTAAIKALGIGAKISSKLVRGVSNVNKAARVAKVAGKIDSALSIALMTHSEASLEAGEVARMLWPKYQEDIDKGLITEEKALEDIAKEAQTVYWANATILTLSNMVFDRYLGKLIGSRTGFASSVNRRVFKDIKRTIEKGIKKSLSNTGWVVARGVAIQGSVEALEESTQGAITGFAEVSGDPNIQATDFWDNPNKYFSGLWQSFVYSTGTTEGEKAALAGFILGAVGGGTGNFKEAQRNYKQMSKLSTRLQTNYKTTAEAMNQVWKRDEEGNIVYDSKKGLTIDPAGLADAIEALNNHMAAGIKIDLNLAEGDVGNATMQFFATLAGPLASSLYSHPKGREKFKEAMTMILDSYSINEEGGLSDMQQQVLDESLNFYDELGKVLISNKSLSYNTLNKGFKEQLSKLTKLQRLMKKNDLVDNFETFTDNYIFSKSIVSALRSQVVDKLNEVEAELEKNTPEIKTVDDRKYNSQLRSKQAELQRKVEGFDADLNNLENEDYMAEAFDAYINAKEALKISEQRIETVAKEYESKVDKFFKNLQDLGFNINNPDELSKTKENIYVRDPKTGAVYRIKRKKGIKKKATGLSLTDFDIIREMELPFGTKGVIAASQRIPLTYTMMDQLQLFDPNNFLTKSQGEKFIKKREVRLRNRYSYEIISRMIKRKIASRLKLHERILSLEKQMKDLYGELSYYNMELAGARDTTMLNKIQKDLIRVGDMLTDAQELHVELKSQVENLNDLIENLVGLNKEVLDIISMEDPELLSEVDKIFSIHKKIQEKFVTIMESMGHEINAVAISGDITIDPKKVEKEKEEEEEKKEDKEKEKTDQEEESVIYQGPAKVVTTGQTGVGQIALEAAQVHNIKTGGFAPTGFKTTSGNNADLKTKYGLEQTSATEKKAFAAKNPKLNAFFGAAIELTIKQADIVIWLNINGKNTAAYNLAYNISKNNKVPFRVVNNAEDLAIILNDNKSATVAMLGVDEKSMSEQDKVKTKKLITDAYTQLKDMALREAQAQVSRTNRVGILGPQSNERLDILADLEKTKEVHKKLSMELRRIEGLIGILQKLKLYLTTLKNKIGTTPEVSAKATADLYSLKGDLHALLLKRQELAIKIADIEKNTPLREVKDFQNLDDILGEFISLWNETELRKALKDWNIIYAFKNTKGNTVGYGSEQSFDETQEQRNVNLNWTVKKVSPFATTHNIIKKDDKGNYIIAEGTGLIDLEDSTTNGRRFNDWINTLHYNAAQYFSVRLVNAAQLEDLTGDKPPSFTEDTSTNLYAVVYQQGAPISVDGKHIFAGIMSVEKMFPSSEEGKIALMAAANLDQYGVSSIQTEEDVFEYSFKGKTYVSTNEAQMDRFLEVYQEHVKEIYSSWRNQILSTVNSGEALYSDITGISNGIPTVEYQDETGTTLVYKPVSEGKIQYASIFVNNQEGESIVNESGTPIRIQGGRVYGRTKQGQIVRLFNKQIKHSDKAEQILDTIMKLLGASVYGDSLMDIYTPTDGKTPFKIFSSGKEAGILDQFIFMGGLRATDNNYNLELRGQKGTSRVLIFNMGGKKTIIKIANFVSMASDGSAVLNRSHPDYIAVRDFLGNKYFNASMPTIEDGRYKKLFRMPKDLNYKTRKIEYHSKVYKGAKPYETFLKQEVLMTTNIPSGKDYPGFMHRYLSLQDDTSKMKSRDESKAPVKKKANNQKQGSTNKKAPAKATPVSPNSFSSTSSISSLLEANKGKSITFDLSYTIKETGDIISRYYTIEVDQDGELTSNLKFYEGKKVDTSSDPFGYNKNKAEDADMVLLGESLSNLAQVEDLKNALEDVILNDTEATFGDFLEQKADDFLYSEEETPGVSWELGLSGVNSVAETETETEQDNEVSTEEEEKVNKVVEENRSTETPNEETTKEERECATKGGSGRKKRRRSR